MEAEQLNQLKKIYFELGALYEHLPMSASTIDQDAGVGRFNSLLVVLHSLTGEEFKHFTVPMFKSTSRPYASKGTYQNMLGAVVSYLHKIYFSSEPEPFPKGLASTNVSVNQHQNVSIVLDVQEHILNKMDKFEDGSKEKSFLKAFKDSLKGVGSSVDLLGRVFELATKFGLALPDLSKIFGGK